MVAVANGCVGTQSLKQVLVSTEELVGSIVVPITIDLTSQQVMKASFLPPRSSHFQWTKLAAGDMGAQLDNKHLIVPLTTVSGRDRFLHGFHRIIVDCLHGDG